MISGEYRDPPRAEAVVDRWNRRGFWLRHAASITFSFTRCLVTPANDRNRQGVVKVLNTTVPVPTGSTVIHYGKEVHYDGAKDAEVWLLMSGEGPETATPASTPPPAH
jgi:hypothetical protein